MDQTPPPPIEKVVAWTIAAHKAYNSAGGDSAIGLSKFPPALLTELVSNNIFLRYEPQNKVPPPSNPPFFKSSE